MRLVQLAEHLVEQLIKRFVILHSLDARRVLVVNPCPVHAVVVRVEMFVVHRAPDDLEGALPERLRRLFAIGLCRRARRLFKPRVVNLDVVLDLCDFELEGDATIESADAERQLDAVHGAVIVQVFALCDLAIDGAALCADEQAALRVEVPTFGVAGARRFEHVSLARADRLSADEHELREQLVELDRQVEVGFALLECRLVFGVVVARLLLPGRRAVEP